MNSKELNNLLKDADHQQVEKLMQIFDRVLLYQLVVHSMPEEFIDSTLNLWDKIVKISIDKDSSYRTDLLESTVMGRKAKFGKMADGEKVRLDALKQWQIARDIITANLQKSDGTDGPEFDSSDY